MRLRCHLNVSVSTLPTGEYKAVLVTAPDWLSAVGKTPRSASGKLLRALEQHCWIAEASSLTRSGKPRMARTETPRG